MFSMDGLWANAEMPPYRMKYATGSEYYLEPLRVYIQ